MDKFKEIFSKNFSEEEVNFLLSVKNGKADEVKTFLIKNKPEIDDLEKRPSLLTEALLMSLLCGHLDIHLTLLDYTELDKPEHLRSSIRKNGSRNPPPTC